MKEYCVNKAHSARYTKYKLEDHFGKNIVKSQSGKKGNIITLGDSVLHILKRFYDATKLQDSEEGKT